MKTFVVKIFVNGLFSSESSSYDIRTGQQRATARVPISEAEVREFELSVPKIKQEAYKRLKPMLAAGGFTFDPTLWKWAIQRRNPYDVILWVTMTFVDESDTPKAEFMKWIGQTGIMNFDVYILKSYG